jgi:hypothetical protein
MLPFSTVDNQHRQSFVATSLDEGFCVMGHGNGARLGAPSLVWDELLERWFQGQIEHRAGYGDHNRRAQKQFRSLRKN